MASHRVSRGLAYAWVVLLSLLVTWPVLLPGFALSYDLVFTPRQDLLPGFLGLGGGLPRAVPQDAVVALIEVVVPGALLEKAVLVGIPVIAGMGMLRLLRSTSAGVIAASFAVFSAFVAQRLVIGHWGLLLAYALIPWGFHVARRLRASGDPWDGLRLLLVIAAASLTPSGSVLITLVVLPPVLLPGSSLAAYRRGLLVAAVAATWLPWVLPALIHPAVGQVDPDGTRVFGLRSDAMGGPVVSALSGGGIWNADVVLASRATALTVVLLVALVGLAALGVKSLVRQLGRATFGWWALVAVAGLGAAAASALVPSAWGAVIESIPGGGLARDAHKLLAPWVLLLAACAGEGGARLAGLVRERAARVAVVVAIAIVPIACQPDMLSGMAGRLQAVDYPDDWSAVRAALMADERPGDVVSFPWASFRRFAWNDDRTMLDPAPRWLPRPTVVADEQLDATPGGVIEVSGDDPRARVISATLQSGPGESLDQVLGDLGIGWALVARGTPGPVPELPGWTPVFEGSDLILLAAPSSPRDTGPVAGLAAVGLVDGVLLASLASGWAVLGLRRVRVRLGQRLVP